MASEDKRIFISYRRSDTAPYAGWLHDRLIEQFGASRIFKDVDSIHPGTDFPRAIAQAIAKCDVILALIGPGWLGVDARGSRIQDPQDWVRLELESALDHGVRVIPLLVQEAEMPPAGSLPTSLQRLRDKQALRLNPDSFGQDVRRLVDAINFSREPVGDDPGGKVERNRVARFAAIDRLYREKVDVDQPMYRYDPFMRAGHRRSQLDALVDVLDFDDDVVNLALANYGEAGSVKDQIIGSFSEMQRGLLALTLRCLIYVPRKANPQIRKIPYSQIMNVDAAIVMSQLTLTLPGRNVSFASIKPRARAREFLTYIRDRIPNRS